MKFEAYRLWVFLFIAIFAVSGYLYFKIQENQDRLYDQSFRSLELTEENLLESWENYRVRVVPRDDSTNHINPIQVDTLMNELLSQMPPSSFFDFVIITDTTGIVLYSSDGEIIEQMPDTTLNQSTELGITQSQVMISQQEYLTFRTPVILSQEDVPFAYLDYSLSGRFYLYGAINQERFVSAGRRISFTQLYLLFTLIIILIISFPIIRVVAMGRGDTLLRSHVYQIGLSIVLLSIFIGYTFSYVMSRSDIIQDQRSSVKSVTAAVDSLHQSELSKYSKLLDTYFENNQPDTLELTDISYNELLEIDMTGTIQRLRERFPNDSELGGLDTLSLPSLANREYFIEADTTTFLVSSHFSYSEDGEPEGVISQKYVKADSSDSGAKTEVVRAITFSFDSFIDLEDQEVNPIGLKYLVINSSGDVFFQSPTVSTNIPDIQSAIERRQWHELSELIANNPGLTSTLRLPISFEGQPYMGHLSKLNLSISTTETYWILVFRDHNLRYLRSYSVFIYSTAGVAVLSLSFLLMSLIFVMSGRSSHFLNIKQFSYSWFRPSTKKANNYLLLIFLILVHILFFLYIMVRQYHNFWFIVFLYSEAVACIALYRFILLSSFLVNWRRRRYWIIPVLITLSVVFFLYLATETGKLSGGESGAISALLILQIFGFGLILFYHLTGKLTQQTESSLPKWLSTETIYALTFTIWVLLIGILAGYSIHQSTYQLEDSIWRQAVNQSYQPVSPGESVELTEGREENRLLDEMELQRRLWLTNVTGINYPVVERYIYAGKDHIAQAFNKLGSEDTRKSSVSRFFTLLILCIIAGIFLFIIIRILARQIFLTEYWDYNYNVALQKDVNSSTYLITLDKNEGLRFLVDKFLSNKKYQTIDLSVDTLPDTSRINNSLEDGFVVLNLEYAHEVEDGFNSIAAFIAKCRYSNKFVLLSGSQSMKDLCELDSPPHKLQSLKPPPKSSWLDTVSYYTTIILPLNYDFVDSSDTCEHTSDKDLYIRLNREVQSNPHTEKLEKLLDEEILENPSRELTVTNYETFILTVQRYSKAYYQNIWEKLSFREKQMVYNYSREGFVNYRNFDVLTELLQKGVFRMDHYREMISLFSISFTNFATQAPTQSLLDRFSEDRKVNGNISEIRNAILTFIFLSLLGLSIVAPDILNRFVGVLSGLLALLSSLASLMDKYTFKIPFVKDQST